MSVVTYEQLALGWHPDSRQDRRFNVALIIALVVSLMVGFTLTSIPIPKEQRDVKVKVPERVAKYITAKPKPKPKVIPEPPKPKPIPKPKFERKKVEEKKPLTKIEKKARKKAEESGLLALTKELSDLVDTASVDSMVNKKINKNAKQAKTTVNTDILTANSGKGSGGVSQQVRGGTGSTARLDDNQRQLARKLLASKGNIADKPAAGSSQGKSKGQTVRSEEDVAYVMDKHKSMLHAIYRRALRKNPGLRGKIVLEITILPSGKVSKVRIKSSELKDASLEASLLARIRQFDFGSGATKSLTVTIPVEFLPS